MKIEEITENLTKVVTFKILTTIRKHYGTLSAFKREYAAGGNRALARYVKNFHVDESVLQRLTRVGGKRYLGEVLKRLDPSRLVYKGHYTKVYKSGKKFSKLSTFYIPFQELDRLFALSSSDDTPFYTKSRYYTDEQHKLIDKLILGYGTKRKTYTKSQRFRDACNARKGRKNLTPESTSPETAAPVRIVSEEIVVRAPAPAPVVAITTPAPREEITDAEMDELINELI